MKTVAALLILSLAQPALAQGDDFPKRAVRMISPNAPGSSNDTLGRILGAKLGEVLGQQVIIENQAGASGLIAMESFRNAQADGYTILLASPAGMSIAPLLQKRVTYDPVNDFQFVSLVAMQPNMLVVTPSLPVKTVRELIDYCRARPGQVNMASAGPGSQSHLAGTMLQIAGEFGSVHVPYKGGGPSVASVMSGESQWTLTPASAVAGPVRSGRLRALAQSLPKRTQLLEGVPAVAETLPGFSYSAWVGLLAPKATPLSVAQKLRAALLKTLALPEVKEGFGKQGAEISTDTPEEFREMVRAEIENMKKVVKAADLKIE
ncbi:MAG TPA: tripartite tricarboxylate transporter substrate-binding protein [Burkholderiales bacterium]|nr:tripartite tricarboxylate transporter substrate-binding protein [Burkholderiales bacterium]